MSSTSSFLRSRLAARLGTAVAQITEDYKGGREETCAPPVTLPNSYRRILVYIGDSSGRVPVGSPQMIKALLKIFAFVSIQVAIQMERQVKRSIE